MFAAQSNTKLSKLISFALKNLEENCENIKNLCLLKNL